MKLYRFKESPHDSARIGFAVDHSDHILDLSSTGITSLASLLEQESLKEHLEGLTGQNLPSYRLSEVQLLAPIERQEVWAAGVTYQRSKTARMEESDFSANAYDKVYDAPRPEIFFKSLAEKVVGPGDTVGIRKDATWNVPEPELVLVLNSKGSLVGYSIGNDMSSRDIEGENLLYLPQAKVYDRSCSLGPAITIGVTEEAVRQWTIGIRIDRQDKTIFEGETSVSQIKRSFSELCDYLRRSQTFPHGVMLLTGTGVVPGDDFTLQAEDRIRIDISGIGTLENSVQTV
jgi:2-dehydro-3-deoxy-D-arabinonate dehydratase